jgi:hypothetical protein
VLALVDGHRRQRLPLPVGLGGEQCRLERGELAVRGGHQAGLALVDEARQVAEHHLVDLRVGPGHRVRGASALVVDRRQVIAERVLDDLVGAQRQLGGVAGQIV